MNKTTLILLMVVVLGGIIFLIANGIKPAPVENTSLTEDRTVSENNFENENNPYTANELPDEPYVEKPRQVVNPEFAELMGVYETYAPEKLALADKGDVVLFFHAPWCPTCRALNNDIQSHLSSIPPGVAILLTDYDNETTLKQKYGVTYQHTMVQVDSSGNMITKWSGSPTLASLLQSIK